MNRLLALLLLAGVATAGDAFCIVGIRESTTQLPDARPPRTIIDIDIHAPDRLLKSRRLVILDPKMRRHLFEDPMLFPARSDVAFLITREPRGMRLSQISWSRGEDVGPSKFVACSGHGRPRQLVAGKMAFFGERRLINLDLGLGVVTTTALANKPLDIDPARNRVYVFGGAALLYHPLTVGQPPEGVSLPPSRAFPFPDKLKPRQASVRDDGLAVAYVSKTPTHRANQQRFVVSVADHRRRLVVRRSLRGEPFDIRWLDRNRVLITATDRESTFLHQLLVKENHVRTRRLSAAYLAPPEIVPARWVVPDAKG